MIGSEFHSEMDALFPCPLSPFSSYLSWDNGVKSQGKEGKGWKIWVGMEMEL